MSIAFDKTCGLAYRDLVNKKQGADMNRIKKLQFNIEHLEFAESDIIALAAQNEEAALAGKGPIIPGAEFIKCEKCHGTGIAKWARHIASGVCFDCQGRGEIFYKGERALAGLIWMCFDEFKAMMADEDAGRRAPQIGLEELLIDALEPAIVDDADIDRMAGEAAWADMVAAY